MSNFLKGTKRAWEENEHDQRYQNELRRYPINENEFFPTQEALFPRHILEPLYEKWKRYHSTGGNNANEFFIFLLKQPKETK